MRNPMKAVAFILFVCLALTVSIGCKPKEVKPTVVELVFWTHQRHDLAYSTKMVDKFNTDNAGKIHVTLVSQTDQMNDAVNLAFENNQAPDIVSAVPNTADYVAMGRIVPLEEYVSPEFLAKMEKYRIPNSNSFNGKFYTFPMAGHDFRLVYNKDLFKAAGLDPEKPPKTYQEVIDYAKKITAYGVTQEPKKYGYCLPTGETWIWWQIADQLTLNAGKPYFDYVNLKFQYSVEKPILELFLQMQKDGSLFPGGLQLKNDPARAQFSEGVIGMMIAASWDIGVFNDQFPAKIDWGVANLPTPDGVQLGKGLFSGGGGYYMTNACKNPKEGAKFLEFLSDDEYMLGYYEGSYGIPMRSEVVKLSKTEPSKKGFSGFANTEIDAAYPQEPPGLALEGDDRGTVFNLIMAGSVKIDEALADLDKRMNDALAVAEKDGKFKREEFVKSSFDPMNPSR